MKILFLTQRIDCNDDLMGFVHGWLAKLAARVDLISAIGLGVGEYHLPRNVKVYSLGKNEGAGFFRKLKYTANFYKLIWALRHEYDLVFVHMNKEYVLLGGLFWRLASKKVFLWYNHRRGNFLTKMAFALSDRVFYTSQFSFSAKYKKAQIMPAGIDVELFKKDSNVQKIPNSILYLGRISPIKNLDTLIEAANILNYRGVKFILDIMGDVPECDREYYYRLKKMIGKNSAINFICAVSNQRAPEQYNRRAISVNLTNSGSLDKSVLEAMACEQPVVLSNVSFREIVPDEFLFKEKNAADLAEKLTVSLNSSAADKENIGKSLRDFVIKEHSLNVLMDKLVLNFESYVK